MPLPDLADPRLWLLVGDRSWHGGGTPRHVEIPARRDAAVEEPGR